MWRTGPWEAVPIGSGNPMQPVRKTKTFRDANSLTAWSFYGQGIGDLNHKNLSISTGLLSKLGSPADNTHSRAQVGASHTRGIGGIGRFSQNGNG